MGVIPTLAVLAMVAALVAGLRWPGVLLAGCLFTYQASELAGVALLDIGYVIAAAAIAFVHFMNSRQRLQPHRLDVTLAVLLLWIAFSTTWAPWPSEAVEYYVRLVLSVGGMYAVGRFVAHRETVAGEMLAGCAVLGGVLAFLLTHTNRVMIQSNRIAFGEASAVGLAQPLPFVIVAAVLVFLLPRSTKVQAAAVASLVSVFYTAMMSGTRSVFLAAALALLVVVPLCWRLFPLRTMGKAGIGVMATVIVAPMFFSAEIERAIERLTVNFSGGGVNLADPSSQERIYLMDKAMDLFLDRPAIGYGHGSFHQLTGAGYPHNLFLEAASETGLIGAALLLVWLATLFVVLVRMDLPRSRLILLAFAITSLAQMMVSFSLFMARPLFLVTALAAALAPKRRLISRPSRAASRSRGRAGLSQQGS